MLAVNFNRLKRVYASKRFFSSHTSCGIVGYPNIGKSTLFNALARTQVLYISKLVTLFR
jgi:ribosome biogenesis GTPase A